jgi:hypothetical protein
MESLSDNGLGCEPNNINQGFGLINYAIKNNLII